MTDADKFKLRCDGYPACECHAFEICYEVFEASLHDRIEEAVRAEREACAELADDLKFSNDCVASAIRARGDQ